MGFRNTWLRVALAALLLVLVLSIPPVAVSARSSLERHSQDFRVRLARYPDVWTQQEVEALTGLLEEIKSYGLAHIQTALESYNEVLIRAVSKLRFINEKLYQSISYLMGLSKELPPDLTTKISKLGLLNMTSTEVIKVLNELYVSGDLGGLEYLALLGYAAKEFKLEHIDDAETHANIKRAVNEVASKVLDNSSHTIPEPPIWAGSLGRSTVLTKYNATPEFVAIATAAAVLVPLMTPILANLRRGSKHKYLYQKVQRYGGSIASSFRSHEHVLSAYWTAVAIVSEVLPLNPWETHREYLRRVESTVELREAVDAFKTLTEEYEGVRYGGRSSYLNPEQLVALVEFIEKKVESVKPR